MAASGEGSRRENRRESGATRHVRVHPGSCHVKTPPPLHFGFPTPEASGKQRTILQGPAVDGFQLRVRHIAAHVDRKIGYLVEREYGRSVSVRHFDAEEVGVFDVLQYESRPQVFFIGADLNVIELNALNVPHVKAV